MIFLPDISQYQAGISVAGIKAGGFPALIARATLGTTPDASFAGFRAGAKAAGMPFVAYHYLLPGNITAQVNACHAAVADPDIPIMIDHERHGGEGTPIPYISEALTFATGMRSYGHAVKLWYLPHWIWQVMGSPQLPTTSGLHLVSSNYVGSGYVNSFYPGPSGPGWNSYGGMKPELWQFTDSATIAGRSIDCNAYEGTLDQFCELAGVHVAITKADVAMIVNTIAADNALRTKLSSALLNAPSVTPTTATTPIGLISGTSELLKRAAVDIPARVVTAEDAVIDFVHSSALDANVLADALIARMPTDGAVNVDTRKLADNVVAALLVALQRGTAPPVSP